MKLGTAKMKLATGELGLTRQNVELRTPRITEPAPLEHPANPQLTCDNCLLMWTNRYITRTQKLRLRQIPTSSCVHVRNTRSCLQQSAAEGDAEGCVEAIRARDCKATSFKRPRRPQYKKVGWKLETDVHRANAMGTDPAAICWPDLALPKRACSSHA